MFLVEYSKNAETKKKKIKITINSSNQICYWNTYTIHHIYLGMFYSRYTHMCMCVCMNIHVHIYKKIEVLIFKYCVIKYPSKV